jgi:hypothetical protein
MRVALARHDALLRSAIREHAGHAVKTMADAFHAVFVRDPDAVAAVDAPEHVLAMDREHTQHGDSHDERGTTRSYGAWASRPPRHGSWGPDLAKTLGSPSLLILLANSERVV